MNLSKTHPKARKIHRCAWCSELIQMGEVYSCSFVVCDGDAWTKKIHLECEEAEASYDFKGDVHYYEGQMERGHTHERNQDTPYNCARFLDCPACLKMPLVTIDDINVSLFVKLILQRTKNRDISKVDLLEWINLLYRISPQDADVIIEVLVNVGVLVEEHNPHLYVLSTDAEELV